MNREKALEILGIANDLSNPDIVYQVKQQLKGLHNDNTGETLRENRSMQISY
ncbi:MAG: hypothetical protein ACR5LB_04170 [Wolbachia sp.]